MKRFVVLTLVALVGCGKTPTQGDCEQLLEHVVELEMAAGGASATTDEARANLAAQKKKVSGYVGQDFLESCVKDLPMSQLKCGLAAKTLDELARCDES
jgi:hypothetical protein